MEKNVTPAERLADHVFAARLMDLNGLGAEGNAFLALGPDKLVASITANGLDADEVHIQHIHGRIDENGRPLDSRPPTLADDADGDGVIELAEGVPTYGPIITSLSSPPGGELSDFPTAPRGRIDFRQVYDLDDPATYAEGFGREQLLPLDLREIVVHGGTLAEGVGAGTGGEADGTPGFKLVLPVATGAIDQAVKVYTADIGALNGSGVEGTATLLLRGHELTVKIEATGLEPGVVHAQHIHGAFDEDGRPIDSTVPGPEQDTDGDGFIEVFEGAATYGPVLVSLTDPIGAGVEGFPTADDTEINFQTVIDLADPGSFAEGFAAADVLPLSLREIVIHGLTVDGSAGAGTPGEIDGTPGFKLLLPVGAGEIDFQGVIAADENVLPALVEKQAVHADEIVAVDASRLQLSLGDVNHLADPAIVANAYTNSVAGAETTTQYVLDHHLNSLATLANNAGMLATVGTVTLDGSVLDFSAHAGLDVLTAVDGTDTAFALLNVDGHSGLYTIDLATAEAMHVGGFDPALGPLNGLAVMGEMGLALADDGRTLVRFDLHAPEMATTVAIGGDGHRLDAIDVRPATGELFGYDDASDSYFVVDPEDGMMTLASSDMVAPTSTGAVDIDWNPTIDRMRTVSEEDENIVFNPETGGASDAATLPVFYDTPDATITFLDEHAGNDSVLGAFLIGEDGSLGPVRSVFTSTEHAEGLPGGASGRPGGGERMAGETVQLSDLFAPEDLMGGGDVGLFLLNDGASLNEAALLESASLGFVDRETGEAATMHSDPAALALVDTGTGQELSGEVVHALAELNADGGVLAMGGIDPVTGVLEIAFEDGHDNDFNDLVVAFDNGTGGDRVLTAAEIDGLVMEAGMAEAV